MTERTTKEEAWGWDGGKPELMEKEKDVPLSRLVHFNHFLFAVIVPQFKLVSTGVANYQIFQARQSFC